MEKQNVEPDSARCKQSTFCDHGVDPVEELIECFQGSGSCFPHKLLTAEPSKFHDQTLSNATDQINRVLASIPADPQGRRASFLVNNLGIMLAWVYHSDQPLGNYCVTPQDDDETVRKALKLKV